MRLPEPLRRPDWLRELQQVLILGLLLGLIRAARRDQPFTVQAVRRLRWLGFATIASGLAIFVIETVANFSLSATVTGMPSADISLFAFGPWFLTGFGFFAIGEVIARGQALRTELEQVI